MSFLVSVTPSHYFFFQPLCFFIWFDFRLLPVFFYFWFLFSSSLPPFPCIPLWFLFFFIIFIGLFIFFSFFFVITLAPGDSMQVFWTDLRFMNVVFALCVPSFFSWLFLSVFINASHTWDHVML